MLRRLLPVLLLLPPVLYATPAAAQRTDAVRADPALASAAAPHVRLTARILVIDQEAVRRAGLSYAVLGSDRVRLTPSGERRPSARLSTGELGLAVFLEAARRNRWVRSETTQQIMTLSGSDAVISSGDLAHDRYHTRTRGPALSVLPTVLADGTVHMYVSARMSDVVVNRRGYGVDASPVAVDTEVIAQDGAAVILASGSSVESTRESGLLLWGSTDRERDVLVVITAEVVRR